MAANRARLSHEQLTRAVSRLREALAEPIEAPLTMDGTIQRFEFAFELFWKTFRHFLFQEGIETATPREAIRAAYSAGYVSDERAWLGLLRARNETSHTYNEDLARRVYATIRAGIGEMESVLITLQERLDQFPLDDETPALP